MKKSHLFFMALFLVCVSGFLWSTPQVVPVGEQFYDSDGNLIQAHGGGICQYDGYYYWFGEDRQGDILVSCYRSRNLKDWEFRNHVLRRSFHSELETANVERPKVVYNPATRQFIMWAHKEMVTDYGQARAAVAVCNSIDGNYTWLRSFRPLGYMSRDCTLFIDDDGTAYFISSANENYDLHIYRLTPDFLDVEQLVYLFDGYHREAPAIFKHQGRYYLFTSGATGWDPNQAKYSTATNLAGPWSGWQNVGDSTTFRSQSTYIQPLSGTRGTSFLYMGDRWAGAWDGPVNDSRYVWLPLRVTAPGVLDLDNSGLIVIDTDTGEISTTRRDTGDLAYLKQVSSSSAESANPSRGGNDGDYATRWCATDGNSGQWWQVDLSRSYALREIEICFEFREVYKYSIETSVDGSHWSMMVDERNNDSAVRQQKHNVNAEGRYVRLTYTGLPSGTWASHYEFIVRGPDNEPTPSPTPFKNMGDVNQDGTVSIVDALMVAQFSVGLPFDNFKTENADVNCDDRISILDALMIAQYSVGLWEQEELGC